MVLPLLSVEIGLTIYSLVLAEKSTTNYQGVISAMTSECSKHTYTNRNDTTMCFTPQMHVVRKYMLQTVVEGYLLASRRPSVFGSPKTQVFSPLRDVSPPFNQLRTRNQLYLYYYSISLCLLTAMGSSSLLEAVGLIN